MSGLRQSSFSDVMELPWEPADQRVSYGAAPQQCMEGWSGESGRDVVLVIHGGCWLNQYDLTHARPLCSRIASLGFTVWSLEYRRIGDPGGGWPGSFDDVKAAVSLVLEMSVAEKGGRLTLMGHSAGGHMALWVAAQSLAGYQGQLSRCIALAAISDLRAYAVGDSPCEQATVSLMGGPPEQYPDRYALIGSRSFSSVRLLPDPDFEGIHSCR